MKTFVALACLTIAALPAAADVVRDVERPLPPMALGVETSEAGNMLSWDPPLASPGAPLDAYNVYRLVDGIRESLGSVGPGATSYLDGDVDFETHTYLYFVTAQSDNGESAPSNLATTTYPYCLDIVGPDGLRKECYEPLPGGPLSIIIH